MNNVSSREVQQQLIALVNKSDLASELFRGTAKWLLQANACFQPNLGWKQHWRFTVIPETIKFLPAFVRADGCLSEVAALQLLKHKLTSWFREYSPLRSKTLLTP